MKLYNIAIAVAATAGSLGAASPSPHRHHQHQHAEKRSPSHVKVVNVPGPTVLAYELNGKLVPETEVCDGIKSGKLQWADGNNVPEICSSKATSVAPEPTTTSVTSVASEPATTSATSVASEPATTSATSSLTVAAVEAYQKPSTTPDDSSSAPVVTSTSQTTSSSSSVAAALAASSPASYSSSPSISNSGSNSGLSEGQGLDRPFPDNEIDCSDFPSDYGAIEIPWMNIGGWAGIQYVTIEGDKVTNIDTAVPGGENCTAGAMCSYACPPGYQKSQWPSTQGSTGQSVGGLQCNEKGKLCLTNTELSNTLCIKGTESETVPLNTQPNSKNPLTCPDSKSYFKHNNDPTTAQYYINNKGVPVEEACIWGADGTGKGNWAPSYLGVGQDLYGKTWLSISSTAQNNPTNYKPLDYTVEIKGDLSGTCRLSGGKYCSGNDYSDCNDQGCTVQLMSGDAVYVLSD